MIGYWPTASLDVRLKEAPLETGIATDEPADRKSVWRFVLKGAVSIVLLWLPLRHVALGAVIREIGDVDRGALLAAALALSAVTLVAALRWAVILRALGMPRSLGVTYPLSLIGLFFGQALPAGVGGDVVRVWLGCKSGLSARVSISSILGDRLTGLLAILLIVTIELPLLRGMFSDPGLFYGIIVMLAAGYACFSVLLLLDRLPTRLHGFRLVRGFVNISADLRTTLLSPLNGVPVLLCGGIVQLGNVLAVYCIAAGLHLHVAFASCLLIVPLANILQSLPISIAGWGVRESFFVAAFAMLGVAAPQALAVSVIFGLLIIATSLPGGIVWLMQGAGSPHDSRDVASTET
jgi:glycosyltransferase 2 family protein